MPSVLRASKTNVDIPQGWGEGSGVTCGVGHAKQKQHSLVFNFEPVSH